MPDNKSNLPGYLPEPTDVNLPNMYRPKSVKEKQTSACFQKMKELIKTYGERTPQGSILRSLGYQA